MTHNWRTRITYGQPHEIVVVDGDGINLAGPWPLHGEDGQLSEEAQAAYLIAAAPKLADDAHEAIMAINRQDYSGAWGILESAIAAATPKEPR